MNCAIPKSVNRLLRPGALIQVCAVAVCWFIAFESAQGQNTYTLPPRTVEDVLAVLDQYKPDSAKIEALKAIVNQEPSPNATPDLLTRFLVERAAAAQELGMTVKQTADLRRAAELAKGTDGEWNINQELFYAEIFAGNLMNAMKLRERMPSFVRNAGMRVSDSSNQAVFLAVLGDISAARAALRSTENTVLELNRSPKFPWSSWGDNMIAMLETARGRVLDAEGKYTEAEAAHRKSITAWERFVEIAPRVIVTMPGGITMERVQNARDLAEARLVENLIWQGRPAEAELVVRNILQRVLIRLGRYAPATARAVGQLASVLNEEGRYRDAELMARSAIDIHKTVGTVPESLFYVNARRTLGTALVTQSRWTDALRVYKEMRVDLAKDAASLEKIGQGDVNWALALVRDGKADNAVNMLLALLDRTRSRLTDSDYETAEIRGFFAIALAANGERDRALSEFLQALPVLLDHARVDAASESGGPARTWRLTQILEAYIALLADLLRQQASVPGLDLFAESFRIADVARGSNVQRALAASAARAAISDPKLAEIARQEQDAQVRLGILSDLLSRLLSAPPDQQLPKIIADIRQEIESLRANRTKLKQEIETRFPDYANLIDPKPATIEQARAALRAGEALISIYVAENKSYVWAIPKQGNPAFGIAALGEKEIAGIVAQVRKAFDANAATIDDIPKFDVAAAHKLYRELLQPVESGWKDATSLLIVPHRALGQLPFGVLVTAPAEVPADQDVRFSGYRTVPWLARKAAITQLPSVNTLVTLRSTPAANVNRREFIGFGDPYFSKEQQAQAAREGTIQVAAATRGTRLRNLTIAKVALPAAVTPTEGQQGAATRAPTAPAVANSSTLAQLARLPDTADEIREIAQALKADLSKDVFLGAQVNEKNVKTLDLSTRKVIAFATHGLVPGDLNGLEQPALALSAPEVSGAEGDGLLTMDEILGLKLNADWVVLSACNTASGEGAGAEAVSGLGRAFFYAGARALLVSNWPVETVSARLLTTDLFKRQAENPDLTRAEALRQTMLALMDGAGEQDASRKMRFSYAHPMFWAPFSLVGDGAGR